MTANAEAQSSAIKKFEVFSNRSSGSKDIKDLVVRLNYYESILENTVRMSATIADTTGILQSLKLSGFEKVVVEVEDNYKNKLTFSGNKALYISKVHGVYSHSQRTIFTLELVSKEFIANEFLETEVYERFNGEISSSISKILTQNLKTKKSLEADPTSNKFNFEGKGKKPFRLCMETAKISVPDGTKNSAGYFFFETYEGFKFKSIDKLFASNVPYKSYIYNLTTGLPVGYYAKILEYSANKVIDAHERLAVGAHGSKVERFNPYNDVFDTTKQVNSSEQKKLGGLESPKLGSDFSEFKGVTRRFFKRQDVGFMPDGKSKDEQLKNAKKENLNSNDTIVQPIMRYNQIFTIILTITIPGDASHRAGNLIYCVFPQQKDGTLDVEPDKELSGIYMISDVCYHVTPTKTFTKMNLIRDSYGKKPKA